MPILSSGAASRFCPGRYISPCVTFNDHKGSTKSYIYSREHLRNATIANFVPLVPPIEASIPPDGVTNVTMHDGSVVQFRSVPDGYDPTNRQSVVKYLEDQQSTGAITTGLLFLDESVGDLHDMNKASTTPLRQLPFEKLCPGSSVLARLQDEFR